MSKLEIRAVPEDGDHRLEMYLDGAHIGEYERSRVKGEDAERKLNAKCREAEGAAELLLDAYRRYGKIAVRWNDTERRKEIRTYQEGHKDPGSGGTVVDLIPPSYWRRR